MADDQFVDIEGVDGVGDAVPDVSRSGAAPTMTRFTSRAGHDLVMLDRLTEVLRLVGTGHGDVGILTATNRQADDVMGALGSAGIPSVSLQKYSGRSSDAVRVGTVKRAKGLDFKQVLLAHVDPRLLDAAPDNPSETERGGGSGGSGGSGSGGSGSGAPRTLRGDDPGPGRPVGGRPERSSARSLERRWFVG
ncbi:hypothetical protein [Curtobacterium flaccumfaciens]|uniref:hypothetical protein n=1 Tax=Curtobacterium flaccumfaciens TaxID=2035 RepID=UPI003EB9C37A